MCEAEVTSPMLAHQSRPGGNTGRDNSNNDPPSLHVYRVHIEHIAGIFPLSRVIDRVSDRNYKKLDEDIFVARSHT